MSELPEYAFYATPKDGSTPHSLHVYSKCTLLEVADKDHTMGGLIKKCGTFEECKELYDSLSSYCTIRLPNGMYYPQDYTTKE